MTFCYHPDSRDAAAWSCPCKDACEWQSEDTNPWDPVTEAEQHEAHARLIGRPTADEEYLARLEQESDEKQRAEEHDAAVAAVAERIRIRAEAESAVRATVRPPVPDGLRLGELLARPAPEIRWRIERLWPRRGRVMLSAQAKTGKTTMRDNLARALADGGKFLDTYAVTPVDGTTAIIDFEMSEDSLQLWLGDQGIAEQERLYLWPMRGKVSVFDLFDEACRSEWARRLRAAAATVLLVDCLGPALAAFGLDESKPVDVGRWLVAFDALLDEAGIDEALIVHHMGHNGERSRGASRLRDWPDAEWKLVRGRDDDDEPDPTRYFSAIGRDVDESEAALHYDPIGRRLSLTGGNRAQTKAVREVPLIVEWVRRNPNSSVTEIEEAVDEIGIRRNGCRRAVSAAVRQKQLCVHKGARRRKNHRVRAECAECAASLPLEPADSQEC